MLNNAPWCYAATDLTTASRGGRAIRVEPGSVASRGADPLAVCCASIAVTLRAGARKLEVHNPHFARPVPQFELWLDGDAAMRLLTMYRNRREGTLGDRLDPFRADATNAFVVPDLDDPPLAMSWLPGLPARRPRTAIDPAFATG